MFVAIRPIADEMCIIEKCMYFYSIHVCVCVRVRVLRACVLLIVECARTLKTPAGAIINSVGKIIQNRQVEHLHV